MPFIDASYFNIQSVKLVISGNEEAIDLAIDTYEPDYLRAVLGQSLCDAFMAGVEQVSGVYFSDQFSDQFFKGAIDDRWSWIKDGHVFEYCGRKLRWPGLENVEMRSPVANYVYWHYVDNLTPAISATGVTTVPKTENSEVVSPAPKARKIWNEMVDWNNILYAMITSLTDVNGEALYPEFVWGEIYGSPESYSVYNKIPLW